MTDPYALGPPPGYRPLRGEPNDLIPPEERAAMYARGAALVREVLGDRATAKTAQPETACPTHPDHPGGTTPAGDPYCPTCRRTPATKETTR